MFANVVILKFLIHEGLKVCGRVAKKVERLSELILGPPSPKLRAIPEGQIRCCLCFLCFICLSLMLLAALGGRCYLPFTNEAVRLRVIRWLLPKDGSTI